MGARLRTGVRRGLWALIWLSYLPLAWPYVQRLWSSEHSRFFPLVLIGVAALVWVRLREETEETATPKPKAPTLRVTLWLLAAWLTLAVAVVFWSSWLAGASAVLAARALLLDIGRRKGLNFTGAWLVLWLTLPLPFRFDAKLDYWLQGIAMRSASYVLDFFRIPNLVAGLTIQSPGQQLPIQDACGGVESLVLLLALAALFVVWMRRPVVHSLLLLISAGYWSAVVSVIRVVVVVYCAVESHAYLDTGWAKQLLDLGLYVVGALLLWSTDFLLVLLLMPMTGQIREEWDGDSVAEQDAAASPGESEKPRGSESRLRVFARRLTLTTLAAMFAGLGALQFVALLGTGGARVLPEVTEALCGVLDRNTLAEQQSGFAMSSFAKRQRPAASQFGVHAAEWQYRMGEIDALVACDFPFVGWNELEENYRAQGWEVVTRRVVVLLGKHDAHRVPMVEVSLRRVDGTQALLMYSLFDNQGRHITPPGTAGLSFSSWYRAINDRIQRRMTDFGVNFASCQIQLLLTGDGAMKSANREAATGLFVASRDRIVETLEVAGGR